MGRLSVEWGFLNELQLRQILREANQRRVPFLDLAQSWNLLDVAACQRLRSRQRAPSTSSGQARLPAIGEDVGGYRVLELLGQGGMGAVFKAERAGGDGQLFALKFILTNEARALERFEREAQAVAAVDRHPNIVSIKSYLRWNQWPCLVFDYVEGQELTELIASKSLTLRQSTKIVKSMAEAIAHSHKHRVLHRDLKPANVLIRGSDGQLFLTDFGLARIAGVEGLTRSQDVLGTPHYMSPEQAGSEHEALGPGTDIWALGVIYYELVTGERPFEGDSAVELMTKILFSEPRRPSALNSELPSTVDALILKALRKDPGERYGTAQDFADDCERVLLGESVMASPVARYSGLRRSILRRIGRKGLAVVILMLVLLGAAGALQFYWSQREQHRRALGERVKAQLDSMELQKKGTVSEVSVIARQLLEMQSIAGPSPLKKSSPWSDEAMKQLILLEQEAREKGFEQSFFEHQSPERWARSKELWLVSQALKSGQKSQRKRLSKSWVAWLRTCDQLRQRNFKSAAEGFEKGTQGQGAVALLSQFGAGLVELARRDWTSAYARFSTVNGLGGREDPELQSILNFLVQLSQDEQWLAVLLKASSNEDLSRVQEALRKEKSSKRWSSFQLRLGERFGRLQETDLRLSVLVYKQLKRCELLVKDFECPEPGAALHERLAEGARRRGDLGKALYHQLRLQEARPGGKSVLTVKQLERHVIEAGFIKKDLESAYLISLEVSRAGIYVPFLRADWAESLAKKGVYDREVERAPFDLYPRFWRALLPVSEGDAEEARARLEDIQFVLEQPRCPSHFQAVMYCRRARVLRRLVESESKWNDDKKGQYLGKALESIEKGLKRLHPAPDKLANEKCLVYEDFPRSLRTGDVIERWLAAAEDWREKTKSRYQLSKDAQLGAGRPANAPFQVMSYIFYKRSMAFAYRSSAVASRRAKDYDKALDFIQRALKARNKRDHEETDLYLLKELILAYLNAGREKEARAVYEGCVKAGRRKRDLEILRSIFRRRESEEKKKPN